MLPDAVRQQITLRTFWMMVANPSLTKPEAKALAAEQLAIEAREQAKHPHKPSTRRARAADASDTHGAPRALLARIFRVLDSIERRRTRPAPSPGPPAAPPAPTLVERVVAALTPAPEPEPPPKQFSLFASSDGVIREIAPDESPQLTSVATTNYRRSTIHSETSRDEKRGGTPRQSWLIG
jgi:hypothetical protein